MQESKQGPVVHIVGNELVSGQNVNCSRKYKFYSQLFLLKKMWVAFANGKATHIFSAEISAYMPYLMMKYLTMP